MNLGSCHSTGCQGPRLGPLWLLRGQSEVVGDAPLVCLPYLLAERLPRSLGCPEIPPMMVVATLFPFASDMDFSSKPPPRQEHFTQQIVGYQLNTACAILLLLLNSPGKLRIYGRRKTVFSYAADWPLVGVAEEIQAEHTGSRD